MLQSENWKKLWKISLLFAQGNEVPGWRHLSLSLSFFRSRKWYIVSKLSLWGRLTCSSANYKHCMHQTKKKQCGWVDTGKRGAAGRRLANANVSPLKCSWRNWKSLFFFRNLHNAKFMLVSVSAFSVRLAVCHSGWLLGSLLSDSLWPFLW